MKRVNMNCKKFLLGAVTCAVVLNIQNAIATEMEDSLEINTTEISQQKKDQLLVDFMWRQDIRLHLSNQWKRADVKAKTWWKQAQYEESIFKVISDAICGCVLKTGTFQNIDYCTFSSNGEADAVYVFRGATPDVMLYSPANWNALVLYNLIFSLFNNNQFNSNMSSEQMRSKAGNLFHAIRESLKHYCTDGIELGDRSAAIEKAIQDINKYVYDLDLLPYLAKAIDITRKGQQGHKTVSCNPKPDNQVDVVYLDVSWNNGKISESKSLITLQTDFFQDQNSKIDTKVNLYVQPDSNIWKTYKTFPCKTIPSGIFIENNIKPNIKVNFASNWKSAFLNELPETYLLDFVVQPENIQNYQDYMLQQFANYWANHNILLQELPSQQRWKTQQIRRTTVTNQPVVKKTTTTTTMPATSSPNNDTNVPTKLSAEQHKQQILQELKKSNALDKIMFIYGAENNVVNYYDQYKNSGEVAQWINVCSKVYDDVQFLSYRDDKHSLIDTVSQVMNKRLQLYNAHAYIAHFDFIKYVLDNHLYQDVASVTEKLLSFGTSQKLNSWREACNMCIDLFIQNKIADHISTKGLGIVQQIIDKNNDKDVAAYDVQRLMLEIMYGNHFQNNIDKSEGENFQQKFDNCVINTLSYIQLYNTLDEKYRLSDLVDKDKAMNKIFELKGDKNAIVKWIDESILKH